MRIKPRFRQVRASRKFKLRFLNVRQPVNVLMLERELPYGVKDISGIGVKRISVGSAFAQLAYGSMIASAQEIANQGNFRYTREMISYEEIETFFT